MKDNNRKRRIKNAHEAEKDELSKGRMSDEARKQAMHRPYCCDMIRAQGEQIGVAEYIDEIRGDADGQKDS